MPRPKRSRKNRPSRKAVAGSMDSMITEMKELNLLQRQQLRYAQPTSKDIQFPLFKQKKYTFVVNAQAFTVNSSTTVNSVTGYYTSLSSLPLPASFTQMFDRYRILYVQLQFSPTVAANTGGPAFITAIDYDDVATPNTEIQQRDTSMVVPVGQYFERTYVPRIAMSSYSGSFTSYANMPSTTWIDSSSPNVQYYGLKAILPPQNTAGSVYNVTARILVQFRSPF